MYVDPVQFPLVQFVLMQQRALWMMYTTVTLVFLHFLCSPISQLYSLLQCFEPCWGRCMFTPRAGSYEYLVLLSECFRFSGITVFQGIIGLALERYRLLSQTGSRPFEPLVVVAPYAIKPWYDLINSELIPLNSVIRYVAFHLNISVSVNNFVNWYCISLDSSVFAVAAILNRWLWCNSVLLFQ